MTLKTPLILAALGALTLSACVDPNAYPEDPNARTKNGAIIGGIVRTAGPANARITPKTNAMPKMNVVLVGSVRA